MPRTKLHKTAERHRAKQQAKSKGDRQPLNKTIALDVTKIDWNRIDNPFILPDGVSVYEPQ